MSALLSPDCRDGNHFKCDGVAWDLEVDMARACECDCRCNAKAAFTIYPHSTYCGQDVVIDGDGTLRMLWEIDGLAWNKSLTDSELAAEYYAQDSKCRHEQWIEAVRGDDDYTDSERAGQSRMYEQLTALHRFAAIPHYDEAP